MIVTKRFHSEQLKKYSQHYYNKALKDVIDLLDDGLPQTMCPNTEDGLPILIKFETEIEPYMIASCYGDKSDYRDIIYQLVLKIANLKNINKIK